MLNTFHAKRNPTNQSNRIASNFLQPKNPANLVKFTSTLIQLYETDVWYAGLHVPRAIAERFITEGANKYRVWLTLQETERWQCALMPQGNGDYFININKQIRERLDLAENQEVTAELEKDTTEYGMPLPDELAELFAVDPEGSKIFHALTPGRMRALIYRVSKPKGMDTRIRHAVTILEYLKSTGGKLDFKELNQAYSERWYT